MEDLNEEHLKKTVSIAKEIAEILRKNTTSVIDILLCRMAVKIIYEQVEKEISIMVEDLKEEI